MDEGKIIASTISTVLSVHVTIHVALDTNDLFTSITTQQISIDKSIRVDVNVIHYHFKRENVSRIFWLLGRQNLADPNRKSDSPLITLIQILPSDGRVPLDYLTVASRDANRSLA